MKICTKCGIKKELNDFYKDKYKKDGHRPDCKICINERQKVYQKNNKEKRLNYIKKWNKRKP